MLSASGPDAEDAVAAIAALIESGMGETALAQIAPPREEPAAPKDGLLRGVMAAPGLAIGVAARLTQPELVVAELGQGVDQERAALSAALAEVAAQIEQAVARDLDPTRRSILGAHAAFLEDPTLAGEAESAIAEGKSAGYAWRSAVGGYVDALKSLADRRMAERVDDLIDLERRVLSVLAGDVGAVPELPAGAILLAGELLPSQLMAVPSGRLAGLCVGGGGPTSHVAILAAAMGLPAIVAVGAGLDSIPEGATLILDADAGTLQASPGASALAAAQSRLAARAERREAARSAARDPARLADGTPVPVLANLGSLAEAEAVRPLVGRKEVAYLRTEFLFLDRERFAPDEDEQAQRAIRPSSTPSRGVRWSFACWILAGTSPSHICQTRTKKIRRSACAACACSCDVRNCCALSSARSCGSHRLAAAASWFPWFRESRNCARSVQRSTRRDGELGAKGRVDLGVMIETPAAAMTADQLVPARPIFYPSEPTI